MNHQDSKDSNEARQDDNGKSAEATASRHHALNLLAAQAAQAAQGIGAHCKPTIVVAGQNFVTASKVETIADLLVLSDKFAKIVGAELPFATNRLAVTSGQLISAVIDSGQENIANEIADLLLCVGAIATMCNVTSDDLRDALKEVTEYRATESINRAIKAMMTKRGMDEL